MVKKLLACLLLVVLWCSCAFAVYVDKDHYSIATLSDGKPDYSDARFNYMEFSVGDTGITASADNMNLSGTLTFSGGNYSFWNGKEMQKVSGTQQSFKLGVPSWVAIGDEIEFYPLADTGSTQRFGIEANGGFNGVTMSWNFHDVTSLDGSLTLPNFLTTAQQLENHVLYFEFIRSGDVVTGIDWRVVKASDTSTALTLDFPVNFLRFRAWNFNGTRILNLKPNCYVNSGDTAEGTLDFDSPIKESDIWRVMTKFYTYDEEADKCYLWDYFTPTDPAKLYLWTRHASYASLVNGKSDYSSAKFADVAFYLPNNDSVIAETKHFTDAGRVTIPGGGYTLVDADTGEILSTVTGNTVLKLKMDPECAIGSDYIEYHTVDDSGEKLVNFAGGADTGLNGKTISWTFPTELNLNGSAIFPNFKSTSEQLASSVPYIELVSKDGYFTDVNYKIVTASDTSTAITPSYNTDFRFYFDRTDGFEGSANSYTTDRLRNTASGTYKLGTPQPVSTVKRVRVRFYCYEDTNNPAFYQWNFYPAPSSLEITTATLPSGTVNYTYSATLAANISGARWSISSGSLPGGLTLNQSTGQITGVPTTSGDYTFTVRAVKDAQSAEKSFTVTISQNPPATITITTTSLPSGTVGASYSAQLEASTAGATWSVSSGTLPAGLSLNASTGAITGTPTAANTYTFTVKAAIGSASAEKSFTVTVNPDPVTTLAITTESLNSGVRGQSYSAKLEANISGAAWSVISGALPEGLTLSTSGTISGTPTRAGNYTFTVRAVSGSQSAEKELSIRIVSIGTGSSSGGCESGLSVSALFLLALILKKR